MAPLRTAGVRSTDPLMRTAAARTSSKVINALSRT
jgi:hypothetical protein